MIFTDRQSFREWLNKNCQQNEGIWLILGKNSKLITVSAQDALEEALCYGWIDGKMQSIDENSYRKYFTKRLPKSKWSTRNIELAKTLIEKGLMREQGQEAIEQAKRNGLWENVKRNVIDEELIQKFKQLIQSYEPAYTHFMSMSNSVQRTYTGFYSDARSDKGRQARLEKIIDRLNKNLKPM